jgi:sRNA-binding carbon storage regulator CsrA
MLILKRDVNEGVIVWTENNPNQHLKISFRRLTDGTYQMCFDGPKSFKILREEIFDDNSIKSEK